MMTEQSLPAAIAILVALPLAPLSRAWYLMRGAGGGARAEKGGIQRDGVLLAAVTASYLLILGRLVFPDILGTDYSTRRYMTIYFNLGLMVVVCIWTALRRGHLGGSLSLGSAAVALVWLYIAAVNSVV
jgi:hypothetical protein